MTPTSKEIIQFIGRRLRYEDDLRLGPSLPEAIAASLERLRSIDRCAPAGGQTLGARRTASAHLSPSEEKSAD